MEGESGNAAPGSGGVQGEGGRTDESEPPERIDVPNSDAAGGDAVNSNAASGDSQETRAQRTANALGKRLSLVTLAALGVVYGDIGTSPLYALKECFSNIYGIEPTRPNVLGLLSMITWSLVLVITVKYVTIALRADNGGEGGSFALLALIFPIGTPAGFTRGSILVALALFGTALMYGDGVITPAMTVLGAMEGLNQANSSLAHFIVPFTLVILTFLFAVQKFGTGKVGIAFGPIMLVYFVTIGVLGAMEIARAPSVLMAVNPWYAVRFVMENGVMAFFILGAVVLVMTGAEALYADMGHFGARPIRIAWLSLVFPALLINYLGQGALIIRDPGTVDNPFFLLAPPEFMVPLLFIATAAAVVASQAMISGAFSITRQGIQLGFIPRMDVQHTSGNERGQIYIPEVNFFMASLCLLIVLAFRNTTNLSAAYGIAVTGTMLTTTVLLYRVMRLRFRWSRAHAGLLTLLFLTLDVLFFGSNIIKVQYGGWVPLALGTGIFIMMLTWKRGRLLLRQRLASGAMGMDLFIDNIADSRIQRVAGTAVFMTKTEAGVPPVLLHHLKHNKVLHERVLIMSVITSEVPEASASERLVVTPLGENFWRVVATYGFMESPDIPGLLEVVDRMGIRCKPMETSYFLGRENLIPTRSRDPDHIRMARWRKVLFAIMARNARSATEFFRIPPNRVVELGTQIEI